MNIVYASTWDSRCGVAEYSHSLVPELEKYEKIDVVSLDPGIMQSPARLAARLNQGDAAHIQHQYPFFGGMAIHRNWFRQAVSRVEVPLIVTVHELDLGDRDSKLIKTYKKHFNAMLFNPPEIYHFIVHSENLRNQMKIVGVDPNDVSVIPEGVPKINRLRISTQNAKSLWNVSSKKVITIFGFVVKRKGYELVLEAMKHLPNDVYLLIAGGAHPDDHTGFIDEVREAINTANLSSRVRITDYLENHEIPSVMAATDLIVAPFTSISNSDSILRAIAYKKPVLASDLPWFKELNERCKGVTLFKQNDIASLAQNINEMLSNKKMLTAASAVCDEYAKYWSVAKEAEQTVNLYREIVKQ